MVTLKCDRLEVALLISFCDIYITGCIMVDIGPPKVKVMVVISFESFFIHFYASYFQLLSQYLLINKLNRELLASMT